MKMSVCGSAPLFSQLCGPDTKLMLAPNVGSGRSLRVRISVCVREGATTINIPDTVGYAIPLSLEASFVLSGKESRE